MKAVCSFQMSGTIHPTNVTSYTRQPASPKYNIIFQKATLITLSSLSSTARNIKSNYNRSTNILAEKLNYMNCGGITPNAFLCRKSECLSCISPTGIIYRYLPHFSNLKLPEYSAVGRPITSQCKYSNLFICRTVSLLLAHLLKPQF